MERRSKTVLVLDGNPHERTQCREVLESEGFKVLAGQNMAEGLALYEGETVHAVVMDLFLDDGPSYELFRRLPPLSALPVVGIMSVFRGPTVRRLLEQRYPFLALLDKPLPGAELVDLLRVHFGADYPSAPTNEEAHLEPFEIKPTAPRAPSSELRPEDLNAPPAYQRTSSTKPVLPIGLDWKQLPDQGELSIVSFPALLTRMSRIRFTGSIKVARKRVRKVIYFEEGIPSSVQSNLLYESLGRLLVREKILDDDACQAALQSAQSQKKRLGEWLLAEGKIDAETLNRLLSLQLQHRLLDVFGWEEARYQVTEGETIPTGISLTQEQVISLIIQGVLVHTRLERVIHDLVDQLHQRLQPLVSVAHLKLLTVGASQQPIIEAISRREQEGTLLELVARFEESAQAYQTVYVLVALGLVAFAP